MRGLLLKSRPESRLKQKELQQRKLVLLPYKKPHASLQKMHKLPLMQKLREYLPNGLKLNKL